ncbi:hypothetical protein OAQ28_09045 [Planktomarina temperata]|nr:hypothetical protein [Planktomarina temperata]
MGRAGGGGHDLLTNSAVDPFGKIPEFKFSAVKVENAKDQIAAE